ncbi:MAG: endonuclease [Paludibacteraceae bacterium]
MKRIFLPILFAFLAIVSLPLSAKEVTPAGQLPTYYVSMNGKSSKSLFDEVHVIVKVGYSSLGYDGLFGAYPETDMKENGKLWDMYSNCEFDLDKDRCGNYSHECDCWNREHSIPKSWYGGTKSGPGCDIFHLVPTDGKVNGMRSNNAFGEVSNATYTYDGSQLGSAASITITGGNTLAGNEGTTVSCSGTVFEPQDQYKGDFARGYMGALLKWAGDYQAFTSGDGGKIFSGDYTATGKFGLTNYGIALLMKWHREDPVSQKEIDRNNGIQATQGNRNPFIDYPYLAEYIWGSHAGEAVDMSLLVCSSDPAFVPGVSNGYDGSGGGTVPDPEETWQITWQVDGEEYTEGNPTTKVVKGKGIEVLPAIPTSCSETSTVFMGWTTQLIAGTTDMAPEVLFTDVANAPEIKSDMTFHAVFAKGETTGSAQGSAATEIALTKEQTNGWTISGVSTQPTYWVLTKDAYIESPTVELSTVESIVVNMRTYGGTAYKTVDITCAGQTLGSLTASNNNLKDYELSVGSGQWAEGSGAIRFSSTTNTDKNGPGVAAITIRLGGVEITYTEYLTTCHSTSTDEAFNTDNYLKPQKVLRDGQLLIIVDGRIYTVYGILR